MFPLFFAWPTPQTWRPVATLLGLLSGVGAAHAQAPAWERVAAGNQVAASGNFSQVNATATDGNGNVYVAGNFSGTVSFGGTALTSAGASDAFVAKWNSAANRFEWAQRAGSAGFDYATSVAVAGTSVYVGGYFADAIAFGSTTLTTAGPNPGAVAAFVAKLADAGTTSRFVWAKSAGQYVEALAVAGANVYVAGSFSAATAGFGATTLANAGASDVFVAKLVDAGNDAVFAWAQPAGGAGGDVARALAVNGANIYVAGDFASATATFGSTPLPLSPASGAFSSDAFVAKLADAGATGAFVWARSAGGAGSDGARALAVSGTSVYVAGDFISARATFGNTPLTNTSAAGTADIFTAKLTDAGSTGAFAWAQRAGGTGNDFAWGLAAVGPAVYVGGSFTAATASFGGFTLTNASPRTQDVVVAQLVDAGPTGTFAWAKRAGGGGDDTANGLAVSGTAVYVAGSVTPAAAFDGLAIDSPAGYQTSFVASLGATTPLATVDAARAAHVALYPNPAHAQAAVRLPAVPGATQATLVLTDALGRVVRTRVVALAPAGSAHAVDLAGLVPGVYTLRIAAGPTTAVRRLVVE